MSRLVRSFGAVAGTATLLGMVVSCGSPPPTPPPGLNEVQLAGWQAYVDLDCATCHGEHREGKRSAPPLKGLSAHWTADQLVSYLRDPNAMLRSNPYLAYRAEQYAIGMPKVSGKSPGYADKAGEEMLRELAEYVLVDVQWPDNQ